jgi:hypothetical protein
VVLPSLAKRKTLPRRTIWLLHLKFPGKYGRLLTGVALFLTLWPVLHFSQGNGDYQTIPALFFSLILAYIIPVFGFITARSKEALEELRPQLELSESEFEEAKHWLYSSTTRQTVIRLSLGFLGGVAHISFLRGSLEAAALAAVSGLSGLLTAMGAVAVWMVMTTVITTLTQQSIQFSRLGAKHVRVSLLNRGALAPFARVSISTSLAIIGALALFPLIGFEGEFHLAESLPGAIAALVPLVIMLVIPVWPVHQRLLAQKDSELAVMNEKIQTCIASRTQEGPDTAYLERLAPLLSYRREIASSSTWPFDIGNITRFSLYLIIPPLTWAGAALIENLVDSLL